MIGSLSKPVIAAVRGHAVGQGCELAGVCDFTIASEDAKLGEIQIRHGANPPVLITPFLVSMKQAKELLLLGEMVDAPEAQRLGLVNRVVPLEKLDEEARALADKILANSRNTIAILKALVNDGARASFDTGMNLERIAVKGGMANMEPNPDRDTRLQAFKEKKR